MSRGLKQHLQSDRERNAMVTVLVAAYLFANSVNILMDGNLTWSVYGFFVLALVFIPPLVLRDKTALAPFEVLLFLAFPFTLKGMELGFFASHTLNYLSASGIALLVVTELDAYTSFRTTPVFAVWLVSLTTVAVAGFWAVGRWLSHVHLGTGFPATESGLMWEFAAALVAGILAGKIFDLYFRRKDMRLKYED